MIGTSWYWRAYLRNRLGDLHSQRRVYGLRSFLPHRHTPARIPAGDGWYCRRCGTRKPIVQKRGANDGRHRRQRTP